MASNNPNPAVGENATAGAGIPGSSAPAHPSDAIPLPAHGFEPLDVPVRELASVPAPEVISRVAVVLVSAAAEKLGLAPGEEPDIDIDQARQLITALAGLSRRRRSTWARSANRCSTRCEPCRRPSARRPLHPDAPGEGPGEQLLS